MNHKTACTVTLFTLVVLVNIRLAHAQTTEQIKQGTTAVLPIYPIHGSDLLRKREQAVQKYISEHPDAIQSNALRKTSSFVKGQTKIWYADSLASTTDDPNKSRYQVHSTCRAVGTNCYIFVEDSSWIKGRVDSIAVDSLRVYFDSKTPANSSQGIFQTDTIAFGTPPNIDGDLKIIILLLDINDGFSGSGGFVEGYFNPFNEINPSQPGFSTSNDAEMFYIDTYPLDLTHHTGLYEGISTLAHEFQHMIHFNMFTLRYGQDRLTFINEGCSLVAEVNCGFPIDNPSYYVHETNHYLLDWRYDDMTAVLTDYSRAARFFVYLRDQAGMAVFKPLVASSYPDLRCIDDALSKIGNPLRFNALLQDWFIANILDDRTIDTVYGYLYPNLPKAVEITYTNPNVSLKTDTVQSYAAEYVAFKGGSQLHATFTASNDSIIIKAVEIGSPNRVLNVTKGVDFSEPLFGTTYTEVHFVVMNIDSAAVHPYSYQASGVSSVGQNPQTLPTKFELSQNYPNPFNPTTTIAYRLPTRSHISLRVYDLVGHEVATLVNGFIEAGNHEVKFNASGLPSGIYFYRIIAGNFTQTRKLALLK